ncbi:glucans biosynthesis protein [Rhizobiales bacterium GAS191]|jgi:glucans biosynthesis protein|nr:glucans biosynthesis protein [Rhizobiales bacterium GAS113]SEC24253.1 glucans biosynthesis protein [Rhizobiales bacterium GAS191]
MSGEETRRRVILAGLGSAIAASTHLSGSRAFAQSADPGKPNARFGYEDVVRRAKDIASVPYEQAPAQLPPAIANLDFDAWRDIRFRPDKAFFQSSGGLFQLQLFHLGFNFRRAVVVNLVRDGSPAPIPYSASLFDFGRTKIDKPLPVNTGFAGFRLHYPVNEPKVMDELVAFLGASYFRFLGRGQLYGLSARGLSINAGVGRAEEFPFFREFWIEQPVPDADRATIYALLDSESVTGAYRFVIYPGVETAMETQVTLFARRPIANAGLAPLTSMFLTAEDDQRVRDDYRAEVHDSDGLLMQAGSGEWLWRPLRNPAEATTSVFLDKDIRGFGLMQRDRLFDHYEDIDLHYERRPSYWVEPSGSWGEGAVELTEMPAQNEATDNIVAVWRPKAQLDQGQSLSFGYRLRSLLESNRLHPGGKVRATFQTVAKALGSTENEVPGSRRFLVDFAGGDLAYYLSAPDIVEIVASVSSGRVLRTFLSPNPDIKGFRAGIDVALDPGQSADIRAFLRARTRALTETWTMPWKAP